MDQELREYLDERFKSIDERFKSIDERFKGVDDRFRESAELLQQFRQETNQRFDGINDRLEEVEADLRHTNVVVEDLHGQIGLVAEGVATVNAKVDKLETKVDDGLKEVRADNQRLYRDLDSRVRKLASA
ncbi:MAG TPA: hypothetical protein VGX68_14130 [Thermoanaerobaculia bacterium]|jgi:chromosome segregation ATPase|nr:hypothetical protein [Thermoanaerobaculia bacterium]